MPPFPPLLEAEFLRKILDAVLARIATAARAAGRAPEEITLVSVAKFHSAEAVAALARLWQQGLRGDKPAAIGENYLQEALAKRGQVEFLAPTNPVEWHFIGHLQSRKAKNIPGNFCLLHTLDSEKLACVLQKSVREIRDNGGPAGMRQRVLLQVNIGREEQKDGVHPEEAEGLAEVVSGMPELALEGLMCIPPFGAAPELSRPYFAALRELREKIENSLGIALPQLSMGMSHDLELAIAEGATIVRVGTDIFGRRKTPSRPE